MPKIFVDLDGCLFPFLNAFWDELVWYHNIPESLYSDYMDNPNKYIDTALGKQLLQVPIIYERYKFPKKELEALTKLSKDFEIWYVTSRPKSVELATSHWIKREHLPEGTLVLTNEKGKLAEQEKPVFVIEDQIHHIQDYLDRGVNVIIWDHNYNQGIQGYRITSLSQLVIND